LKYGVFFIFTKHISIVRNRACLTMVPELCVKPALISIPCSAIICNPSLVFLRGHFKAIVRRLLPSKNKIANINIPTSENWIVELDQNLQLIQTQKIDDFDLREAYPSALLGLEDGRLFIWKGQEWVLFSGFSHQDSSHKNTMFLCRLDGNKFLDVEEIKSPFRKIREKNWMPWVLGDDLYFVYSCAPLEIFKYLGDGKLQRTSFSKPSEVCRQLRSLIPKTLLSGSTQIIPWEEAFLGVIHYRERTHPLKKLWMKFFDFDKDYQVKKVMFRHRFILFGEDFSIKSVSKPFCFEQDGVEFCAGLAIQDKKILLSYGLLDREAKIIEIDEKVVREMLSITPLSH
jgi:hypothetical protein